MLKGCAALLPKQVYVLGMIAFDDLQRAELGSGNNRTAVLVDTVRLSDLANATYQ